MSLVSNSLRLTHVGEAASLVNSRIRHEFRGPIEVLGVTIKFASLIHLIVMKFKIFSKSLTVIWSMTSLLSSHDELQIASAYSGNKAGRPFSIIFQTEGFNSM